MDKIKSLLLPLALVFAAIAIFETGVRYGSTNMRAYAIASELKLPLSIYVQGSASLNEAGKEQLAFLIDGNIAAGAVHREVWYLSKRAKAALDSTLAYALSVRGEDTLKRFSDPDENTRKMLGGESEKVLSALASAKLELVDNAPSVAEKDAANESAQTISTTP